MLRLFKNSTAAPKNSEQERFFSFRGEALQEQAQNYAPGYAGASPFPHAVIDDFLPIWAAERALEMFPAPDAPFWFDWKRRDPLHQPGKQGIGSAERLEGAPAFIHNLLFAFNSAPFLRFLETLTGIEGLIPDPHLHGGGLHQILPGGQLAVHADFNYLEKLKLYRRLNVLLYLNKNWRESYGGLLELWAPDMSRCVTRIAPEFNRCVIFSTSSTSYHGHPEPLACPEGMTRKSIALYYYTRDQGDQAATPHDTLWQGTAREMP